MRIRGAGSGTGTGAPSHHAHAAMARVDMKDFFMSGSSVNLAKHASSIILDNEGERHWIQQAILFLLNTQVITSPLVPGRSWRVVRGSGMGCVASAAICEAGLHMRSEKSFVCKKSHRAAFKIDAYLRFRDDI